MQSILNSVGQALVATGGLEQPVGQGGDEVTTCRHVNDLLFEHISAAAGRLTLTEASCGGATPPLQPLTLRLSHTT